MGTWKYTYDNLNRLITANAPLSQPTGVVKSYGGLTTGWSYDPWGNRTAENQNVPTGTNPMPNAAIPTASSATYNTSNQMITASQNGGAALVYDAAGDVTYDGLNSYLYDAEGRICAAKNSVGSLNGYVYDAAGIRVAKGALTSFRCNFAATGGNGFAVNTSWALGQGGEHVAEFSVSGSTSTWKHSNVYAGKLLGTYDAKGLHFYLDDWLGTRRIQTSALGQLELTCQSLPYGNGQPNSTQPCYPTALSTAEDPTEQHFTGKERDAESGDDYFEARYYNSAAGRFLSPDWSAKEEPVPYAKLDDPQTLNLYDYVRNNPMIRLDADGHSPDVTFKSKDLEKDFNDLANESPTFKAELGAAQADHRMNVIVEEPGAVPMTNNAPADAHVNGLLDGTGPVRVEIKAKAGDKKNEAHEMGHEKDARTNTKQFMHDAKKTADDKGGPNAVPHNDRPEEKRADSFANTVNQERRQFQKAEKEKKKEGSN